eukprot:scaffold10925_cov82-Skeletonema_marinoi.AAC.1
MCYGTENKGRCTRQFILRSSLVDMDPPRLAEAIWGGISIGGAWHRGVGATIVRCFFVLKWFKNPLRRRRSGEAYGT